MARKLAAGELQTTWFERHGSMPITELPAHWPTAYRDLVQRRIALIESDRNIALIEQPEYKRRWNIGALGRAIRTRSPRMVAESAGRLLLRGQTACVN